VEAAYELAKKESKPVMWVVMMDGEIACRRMMSGVYADPAIIEKTKSFVVIPCSLGRHQKDSPDDLDAPCSQFPGVTCTQHRANELTFRERYETRREVIAPQHVFTDPSGQVLSRKDWELNTKTLREEMDRALTAFAALSGSPTTEEKATPTEGAAPAATDAEAAPKMSPEEGRLLNLLLRAPSDAKKESADAFYTVASQPGYAALVDALLGKQVKKTDDLNVIIRAAGKSACNAGAKDFVRLAQDKSKVLRHASIVTLEEMEDASVAPKLLEIWAQEKTPEIRVDLLRALGPAGKGSKEAKDLLLKELQGSNVKHARASAIALAAHFPLSEDVRPALTKTFSKTSDDLLKKSILYAYATVRDETSAGDLDVMATKERNKEMKDLVETVARFLRGEVGGGDDARPGGGGRRGGGGGDFRNLMRAWRSLFEDVFKDDVFPRNRNARDLMRGFGMGL
jgi:hypothetical protein